MRGTTGGNLAGLEALAWSALAIAACVPSTRIQEAAPIDPHNQELFRRCLDAEADYAISRCRVAGRSLFEAGYTAPAARALRRGCFDLDDESACDLFVTLAANLQGEAELGSIGAGQPISNDSPFDAATQREALRATARCRGSNVAGQCKLMGGVLAYKMGKSDQAAALFRDVCYSAYPDICKLASSLGAVIDPLRIAKHSTGFWVAIQPGPKLIVELETAPFRGRWLLPEKGVLGERET